MSPKRKPVPEIELSTHPELLYTPGVKATELTLLGVHIGDPTSRIPLDALHPRGCSARPLLGTYYVYPGRQLLIYWNEDEQKITDISLGRHVIAIHDSFRAYER